MLRTWALATAGLLAFAALVWFAGPLLVVGGRAPLASPEARWLVVAVFTLQWLAQKLWSAWRAQRNNERVLSGLAPELQPELSGEAAQLRERFATALGELRRARLGTRGPWQFARSYLYQLPWYVIIGAPGTGKTTALLNSGLSFPLADKLGRGAVRGFGGTRNCDWWFTDRAVLIDTAGRYTTHESDPVADRRAWEAFLQLLRRTRPRRPLNGILVAVSVEDVLGFNPEQLAEHARTLRARIAELQGTLRADMPVYVLLTKCDLLPGFIDWFGTLARKERDQVWGVTFDLRATQSGNAAADLANSFDRLVDRLADALVERMRAERDSQRRARIFSLPSQLRALSEPLAALVRGACGASRSGSGAGGGGPLLRGVYLTSGTQGGTPIDRMLSAFGRELGLERQILPPNRSTGKSFFLAGLLDDVVLAEAEGNGAGRRYPRRLLAVPIIFVLFLAVAVAAWWVIGYSAGVQEMARLDSEVTRLGGVIASLPTLPDADPRPLLPALDSLRDLARTPARAGGPAELIDIAARTRRKLAAAAADAYDRMLLGPFQGRIARAIDTTMRAGVDVNVQYEALKAYQMLNDAGHFDAAGFKIFVTSFWDSALTPPLRPMERQKLLDQMDALLKAGAVGSGIKLEPALIDSVRTRLRTQPSAQRISLRLAVLLDARSFEDFTVASLGPVAAELFVGADGRSEPRRVPGRYTLEAYRDVVSTQVPALAAQLMSESGWVLGTSQARAEGDVAEVIAAYRASYTWAWAEALDDLHLKPVATSQEASGQAQALGEADGPLVRLLREVVRQTPLRLQSGAEGPITAADPAADRFVALANLVARDSDGGGSLDAVLQSFRELATLRAAARSSATLAGAATAADRLARIVANAHREPEPVRSMLLALAEPSAGAGLAVGSPASAGTLSRRVSARLGLACIQLVAGRFPFDRRATRDASFEEFSRVFGPKGAFDEVFAQLLAGRVDTSSETWRWVGAGARPAAEDLERFRSAARIRDVFFRRGGTRPGFQLTFRPVDLHEEVDRFQLEIDGQPVRYAHGPPLPTTVKWPGPHGKARIELTPASAGGPIEYTGPWALFRLLDHAAIQDAGAPGRFRVVFDVGGRKASFEVETDNRANPFRLRELERFDCPISGQ